jgi:hypothetical protein
MFFSLIDGNSATRQFIDVNVRQTRNNVRLSQVLRRRRRRRRRCECFLFSASVRRAAFVVERHERVSLGSCSTHLSEHIELRHWTINVETRSHDDRSGLTLPSAFPLTRQRD